MGKPLRARAPLENHMFPLLYQKSHQEPRGTSFRGTPLILSRSPPIGDLTRGQGSRADQRIPVLEGQPQHRHLSMMEVV